MPHRKPDIHNLFPRVHAFDNLLAAARAALRGKRSKPGAAAFASGLERHLIRLQRELIERRWFSHGYTVIDVREPKPRRVSAAPFADRVVHHALCRIIEPIFERGFINESFANRTGFGTHRAVARYEKHRNRFRHVLRADIYRFFPAIDHAILKADLARRIGCEGTRWLLDVIIDGSNAQEPVNLYYPGDSLFTPFERKRGLPIGNLTSQFFGNVFLNPMDHFVKEVLRAPYVRYVDDFALFHHDPAVLADWQQQLANFLAKRRLSLHPRKTFVAPTAEPATFLGYVLKPGGYGIRRLPDDNVDRFVRRLHGLRDQWRAGTVTKEEIECRIQSWIGHAQQADTKALRRALFKGGWFDPGPS